MNCEMAQYPTIREFSVDQLLNGSMAPGKDACLFLMFK